MLKAAAAMLDIRKVVDIFESEAPELSLCESTARAGNVRITAGTCCTRRYFVAGTNLSVHGYGNLTLQEQKLRSHKFWQGKYWAQISLTRLPLIRSAY